MSRAGRSVSHLCVKGDEETCDPASEYPTSRKVQSHLCWLTKSTFATNFSFTANNLTLNAKRALLLWIRSQQIASSRAQRCGGASSASRGAFLRPHSRLGSCTSHLSSPHLSPLISLLPRVVESAACNSLWRTEWLSEGGNSSHAVEKFSPLLLHALLCPSCQIDVCCS